MFGISSLSTLATLLIWHQSKRHRQETMSAHPSVRQIRTQAFTGRTLKNYSIQPSRAQMSLELGEHYKLLNLTHNQVSSSYGTTSRSIRTLRFVLACLDHWSSPDVVDFFHDNKQYDPELNKHCLQLLSLLWRAEPYDVNQITRLSNDEIIRDINTLAREEEEVHSRLHPWLWQGCWEMQQLFLDNDFTYDTHYSPLPVSEEWSNVLLRHIAMNYVYSADRSHAKSDHLAIRLEHHRQVVQDFWPMRRQGASCLPAVSASRMYTLQQLLVNSDDHVPPEPWQMAKMIFQERAWKELPVLADCLEDHGLDHFKAPEVLDHLRLTLTQPQHKHFRGCWALELILGRGVIDE